MSRTHRLLCAALLLLATLFAIGFRQQPNTLMLAVIPPLLVAYAIWKKRASAPFWASVLALGWFTYGVMESWTLHGAARLYALAVTGLALIIIAAGNYSALRARFAGKSRR